MTTAARRLDGLYRLGTRLYGVPGGPEARPGRIVALRSVSLAGLLRIATRLGAFGIAAGLRTVRRRRVQQAAASWRRQAPGIVTRILHDVRRVTALASVFPARHSGMNAPPPPGVVVQAAASGNGNSSAVATVPPFTGISATVAAASVSEPVHRGAPSTGAGPLPLMSPRREQFTLAANVLRAERLVTLLKRIPAARQIVTAPERPMPHRSPPVLLQPIGRRSDFKSPAGILQVLADPGVAAWHKGGYVAMLAASVAPIVRIGASGPQADDPAASGEEAFEPADPRPRTATGSLTRPREYSRQRDKPSLGIAEIGADPQLDTTALETWLTDYLNREISRPRSGIIGIDPGITPTWSGPSLPA